MSLCRILNAKCARCDRNTRLAYEAAMHPMQWSPDVLEEIWTHVRHDTGMWRARMRKRLWAEVHKELDDEWRSLRPDDPPSEPGGMEQLYPAEIYNGNPADSYKELEDNDGAPISYSYSEFGAKYAPDLYGARVAEEARGGG
eukprot:2215168-Prymnesium_polylepis.2